MNNQEEAYNIDSTLPRIELEKFIKFWWGERCEDYLEECECCKRWKAIDMLFENPFSSPKGEEIINPIFKDLAEEFDIKCAKALAETYLFLKNFFDFEDDCPKPCNCERCKRYALAERLFYNVYKE